MVWEFGEVFEDAFEGVLGFAVDLAVALEEV